MKPKFSDLITYINKALTGNDWNTNWQKIVNWLTLGTYDLKVNKIETNEIENSGTFTQNGNLIADNVQADTVTANSFVGDGSGLDNVRVTNTFPYTPFCVNSAKSNFIVNGGTKLTFLVDDGTLHQPLVVTTADGKQITITSINDYDVSGLNGTYYIFVDEETNGGTVYLKSCTIYRQVAEPTGQNGDIWLDTSNEPFICRERVSNNWYSDIYNKVPVGKVVVSGGTITDVKTLPFAVNGANVVYDGQYSNINGTDIIFDSVHYKDQQRPIVVVQAYENNGTWYRIYSDGWVEQGGITEGGSSGNRYITLPIEMKYDNYCITPSAGIGSGGGSSNNTIEDITTTGFKIWSGSPSYYTWEVKGIMK